MKNKLFLTGILATTFLTGCAGIGSAHTEVTPASTKVEQTHEMDNPGTITDRVINIQVNPKAEVTPALKAKPLANYIVNEGLSEPVTAAPTVDDPESTSLEINGNKIKVPKGDSVSVSIKENIKESSKKVSDKASAEAKGAGIKTDGPGGDKFNASAPSVGLTGVGTADGGDTTFKGVVAAVKGGSYLLYWFGGILIVAGVLVGAGLKEVKLGVAIAGGGGALIATAVLIEQFPWVFLLIPVAAIGIGAYSYFHLKSKNVALGTVATGIEDLATTDPASAEKVKSSIADAAGKDYDKVKAEITKIKKKLGL